MTYFAVLFHAHTDWICDTLIMNCSHFLFLMYVLALVKCKECLLIIIIIIIIIITE